MGNCCGQLTLEVDALTNEEEFSWRVTPASQSGLLIEWFDVKPAFYKIRYRKSGSRIYRKHNVPFGRSSFLIKGLDRDTEYEVSIEDKSTPPELQEWKPSKFVSTRGRTEERSPLLGRQR